MNECVVQISVSSKEKNIEVNEMTKNVKHHHKTYVKHFVLTKGMTL